jgi:hypothetical protein
MTAAAALDALDGAGRADVLDHVAGCVGCRAELRELVTVADGLLLLAPEAEPPPGFETRALARIAAGRPARGARSWRMVALAAAVVVAVAVPVGVLVHRDSGARPGVVAARLVGTDGTAVGQVLVSADPDRMVCVLDWAPAGERYRVSVRAGGQQTDLGTFTAAGPGQPWGTSLPVRGSTVRRVEIRDDGGTVRATADL